MKSLFTSPGSLPFLGAVFLNAFVDLGHKIVIQNTIFKVYDGSEQVILTAIVNGLILLPFIILFSPAGHMSDRYAKHRVMQITAWAAVVLTCGITACYALGWFWAAFAMTFLLAAQSAFYSPAKLGYIRGFFGKQHLAEANGVVVATTIIAILAGTLVFSVLFESMFPPGATSKAEVLRNLVPVGMVLMLNSLVQLVMMYRVPQKDTPNANIHFDLAGYFKGGLVRQNLRPLLQRDVMRLAIIGLAMFWSIGQVMLAAFPDFAEAQTGEKNTIVIQSILAASGLGIALGSVIASRVSKNYIETSLIPIGAAGIALGLGVLPNLNSQLLMGLDFMFIGTMGGLFIVPLNAMIQFYANENELGKVLAGNNLMQNIAMLSFLAITVAFALMGISSRQLLMLTAVVAVVGGCYTVYKLPQSLVRFLLSYLLSRRYRISVQGMKNIPSRGGVLLLGNHISWIDWALIQIACPRPVRFVMHESTHRHRYLHKFFRLFACIPIAQGADSNDAVKQIAALLNSGKLVCLFPEGAPSRTGHLGEFRRGYERAAQLCGEDVVIQPFYLRGLRGSQFARSPEKLERQSNAGWKRDIVVTFGEPMANNTKADVLKRRIFDLSVSSWQRYAQTLPPLAHAWIDTAKCRGADMAIADTDAHTLSSTHLLGATIAFARRLKRLSPEQNVGLLLPTSAGGVIANMAALMLGKTIVNLNYSVSPPALRSALARAEIKTVYTSHLFLRTLADRGIDFSATLSHCRLVYIEEVKTGISTLEMAATLVAVKLLPAWLLKKLYCRRQEATGTAAILFSSGSEDASKGVMLSHRNFMANLKQIADVLNLEDNDVVMASLPLCHAFGLTVTQFLPLIEGLPMICHPDPNDALGIAKGVAKYRATIMCSTSNFLCLYTRDNKVHPLMLESLRLAIAGAEKPQPQVREAFKLKFNKDILEGYGTAETTPIASVNLPDALDLNHWRVQTGGKSGTVGRPLPGTRFKIVDPDSWRELANGSDGMILIGGAQVMQGYLNDAEKTDAVIKVIDSACWYVTGDEGHLDDDGFLTIGEQTAAW